VCAIAPSFYFLSFRDCPFPATPPSNSAPVVVICLTVRLLYCLSQLGVPGRSRHVSCLSRNAIPPVHLVNHENVNVWTIWNQTKTCSVPNEITSLKHFIMDVGNSSSSTKMDKYWVDSPNQCHYDR
jgi:hypothetical protein